MVTAAGEPIQMICNAREGRDAAGKPLFTRLALLKATDRLRYEQELLAARDSAKTSLASEREISELREQFMAVLGHDLRNPLASISAGARILGRDATTEKQHQVAAMLQTTVMRMAALIDNVLDFARGRLGGGITLDRDARRPLEPVLHQVIVNCGCLRRAGRSRLHMPSKVPWIATEPELGSLFPILSAMPSVMEYPTSPCV